MAHKIMAEVLQPIYDAEGNLALEPGLQVAEGDKRLKGLAPGSFRLVIVEDDTPEPAPKSKSGYSSKSTASAD